MAHITLVETEAQLSYTGTGDIEGFSIVVQKDDTKVDVHQITPIAQAGGQTWKDIRDQLAKHLL